MKITQNTQCLNFETFFRSNQDTCLSQRPLIKQGQWVGKGQLLADSISSVSGDLALGKNVLVAYMPWEGYNFEDSIVISDRLIADDVYTSIHVLRFRTEIVNNLSTNSSKPSLESSNKTPLTYDNFSLVGGTRPSFYAIGSKGLPSVHQVVTTPSGVLPSVHQDAKQQPSGYIGVSLLQQFCNKYSNKQAQQKNKLEKISFLQRLLTNDRPSNEFFKFKEPRASKGTFGLVLPPLEPKNLKTKAKKVADKIKFRCSNKQKVFGYKQIESAVATTDKSKMSIATFGSSPLEEVRTSVRATKGLPKVYATYPFQRTQSIEGTFGPGALTSKRSTSLEVGPSGSVTKTSKTQRKLNENRHASNVETRTPNIPFLGDHLLSHLDQDGIAKVGTWVSPGDILVGKVRPLANKLKSNRASTQLAWEIISSKKNESINVEDKSFRLPKGVSGRVIRTEILPHSSNEQIHIYLAVKRKVQVGDKLAGRHGNKGIVSLVLPRQDMPYLADGTPIDIILSPLGVPSRMNVGQIYECLLGLAAKSLICNFKLNNSMATLGKLQTPKSKLLSNKDYSAGCRHSKATFLTSTNLPSAKHRRSMLSVTNQRFVRSTRRATLPYVLCSSTFGQMSIARQYKSSICQECLEIKPTKVDPRVATTYLAEGLCYGNETPGSPKESKVVRNLPSRAKHRSTFYAIGRRSTYIRALRPSQPKVGQECLEIFDFLPMKEATYPVVTPYAASFGCRAIEGYKQVYLLCCAPDLSASIYSMHMKRLITLLTKFKNNINGRKVGLSKKQIKDQNDYYIGTSLIKGSAAVLSKTPLSIDLPSASTSEGTCLLDPRVPSSPKNPTFAQKSIDLSESRLGRFVSHLNYSLNSFLLMPLTPIRSCIQQSHQKSKQINSLLPSRGSMLSVTNQRFLNTPDKSKICTDVLCSCTEVVRSKPKVESDSIEERNPKVKFQESKQLILYSNLEARNLVFLKLYHSRITCNKKWLFSLTNPGKMKIFDGRTGQPFSSWVTVGYAYMLKLIHLVDNKIHSRSTGPYSLITRQPVTGKARQGGQRIGEMEAWALEGFGAAYTLQEFFSFKGDDVSSRHQWQINSLSKLVGNTTAFKTFLSELRALCISLEFTGFTEGL